jgi:hypothetical protein
VDRVDRVAGARRRVDVRSRSASPCTPSWRRPASSEAISSELGLVDRTRRTARATAPVSIRPVGATWSIADWVRLPTILCVEVSITSAPSANADSGRPAWKPKCEPQALSTMSAAPAAWATSAQMATSAAMP